MKDIRKNSRKIVFLRKTILFFRLEGIKSNLFLVAQQEKESVYFCIQSKLNLCHCSQNSVEGKEERSPMPSPGNNEGVGGWSAICLVVWFFRLRIEAPEKVVNTTMSQHEHFVRMWRVCVGTNQHETLFFPVPTCHFSNLHNDNPSHRFLFTSRCGQALRADQMCFCINGINLIERVTFNLHTCIAGFASKTHRCTRAHPKSGRQQNCQQS